MTDGVVKCVHGTLNDATWLRYARSNFDVVATLTFALSPSWTVDRELDACGELIIIVLPADDIVNETVNDILDDMMEDIMDDTASRPSFILYEADAVVQVSTFVHDEWRSRQTFGSCPRAVAAIIEAASRVCPPPCQASRTSRSVRARSSVL